jgi:hypothetical protein
MRKMYPKAPCGVAIAEKVGTEGPRSIDWVPISQALAGRLEGNGLGSQLLNMAR